MSIGTVVTAFALLGLFSLFFISIGAGVDKIYVKNNEMIAGDHDYSQSRLDAMTTFFIEIAAFPVIVLILIFFWAIKQAISDKDTVI